MKVLVTGAAGFIGSHTVDQLLAAGHTVTGVDNLRTGRLENLRRAKQSAQFRFWQTDLLESRQLDRIVVDAACEAIIHLAAMVGVQESIADPALCDAINVRGTQIVLETARRRRVPRVVFASSAAVYGEPVSLPVSEKAPLSPPNPYGESKLAAEILLFAGSRGGGPTVVCLRYFNVYGPRQDPTSPYSGVISVFQHRLSTGGTATIYGDGEQTRDFIFVGDVARANLIAATRRGLQSAALNICTGKATSLNELFAAIHTHYPAAPAPAYAPARRGEIRHSRGDPALARDILDFSAATTVESGLGSLLADHSPAET